MKKIGIVIVLMVMTQQTIYCAAAASAPVTTRGLGNTDALAQRIHQEEIQKLLEKQRELKKEEAALARKMARTADRIDSERPAQSMELLHQASGSCEKDAKQHGDTAKASSSSQSSTLPSLSVASTTAPKPDEPPLTQLVEGEEKRRADRVFRRPSAPSPVPDPERDPSSGSSLREDARYEFVDLQGNLLTPEQIKRDKAKIEFERLKRKSGNSLKYDKGIEDGFEAAGARRVALLSSYDQDVEDEVSENIARAQAKTQIAIARHIRENTSTKDVALDILHEAGKAWATKTVVEGFDRVANVATDFANDNLYKPYLKPYLQPSEARDEKRSQELIKQANTVNLLLKTRELCSQEDDIHDQLLKLPDQTLLQQLPEIGGTPLHSYMDAIQKLQQRKLQHLNTLYTALINKGGTLSEEQVKDLDAKTIALKNLYLPSNEEAKFLSKAMEKLLSVDPQKDPNLYAFYYKKAQTVCENILGFHKQYSRAMVFANSFMPKSELSSQQKPTTTSAVAVQQPIAVLPTPSTATLSKVEKANKEQLKQNTVDNSKPQSVTTLPANAPEKAPVAEQPVQEKQEVPAEQEPSLAQQAREYLITPSPLGKYFTWGNAENSSTDNQK